jgi:hypothetical protein
MPGILTPAMTRVAYGASASRPPSARATPQTAGSSRYSVRLGSARNQVFPLHTTSPRSSSHASA